MIKNIDILLNFILRLFIILYFPNLIFEKNKSCQHTLHNTSFLNELFILYEIYYVLKKDFYYSILLYKFIHFFF